MNNYGPKQEILLDQNKMIHMIMMKNVRKSN